MSDDVKARLNEWQNGSYDVEIAAAKINVRDVRDTLALINAQEAEIARLHDLHLERTKLTTRIIAERDAARAELAAVNQDARRYRWLRENVTWTTHAEKRGLLGRTVRRWYHDSPNWEETLDAALDTAAICPTSPETTRWPPLNDYRLCDLCSGKVFYDANLNYDQGREVDGIVRNGGILLHHTKLDYLGDWAVICDICAVTHECVIQPRSIAETKP
jgi:hypothetical protein